MPGDTRDQQQHPLWDWEEESSPGSAPRRPDVVPDRPDSNKAKRIGSRYMQQVDADHSSDITRWQADRLHGSPSSSSAAFVPERDAPALLIPDRRSKPRVGDAVSALLYRPRHRRRPKATREFPVLLVVALLLAVVVKTFLFQAFYIPSVSMVPTLQVKDRIVVCRICVRVSGVSRGDVVVFASPHPAQQPQRDLIGSVTHAAGALVGVAQPDDPDYVKRVIGLEGDMIELRSGVLYRNGVAVSESYLSSVAETRSFGPVTVPPGMLFVMGDNRTQSGDSRFAPPMGLGYVPVDRVIGKAFVIIWPIGRTGSVS